MTQDRHSQLAVRTFEVAGHSYLRDAKGNLVPVESVRPLDLLEDDVVTKILTYAEPLSAEIARFREHTFDDVDAFVALSEQHYGSKRGGMKGNLTFSSYDGLVRITVSVADLVEFDSKLQIAKGLLDECLLDWAADSRAELRAMINLAFNVEQPGRVNRAGLVALLRIESADERWNRAMDAIRDSQRVVGSKRYVRIHRRATITSPWTAVSLDMATA